MKNSLLVGVLVMVLVFTLVGCQQAEPAPAVETGDTGRPGQENARGLFGETELSLGTIKLEGTGNAVTPAQAAELLPLWQVIQSGSLQGGAETAAVLKQIEGQMTEAQIAAIEAMALTMEDVQAWMQEQGIEMPEAPEGQARPGTMQDMSEEERAQMRQEFQNMTAEERATRMAEQGIERPQGAPEGQAGPGGREQGNALLAPLIGLLTQRASE